MSEPTFDDALRFVLRHEGGVSDHPADHGGLTNLGITQRNYNRFRAHRGLDVRSVEQIEKSEVWSIYLVDYWQRGSCELLPARIAFAHFDGVVNSGPTQSALWLQRALWIPDDGEIGPTTLSAATRSEERLTIYAMLSHRQAFLRSLAVRDSSQSVFVGGWLRRVRELWNALFPQVDSPESSPVRT